MIVQQFKDNSMPVTFNLDDDVSLSVQPLIMELRKNGYKGMSRTFLLNSSLRYILKIYQDEGVGKIKEIIQSDYDAKKASKK